MAEASDRQEQAEYRCHAPVVSGVHLHHAERLKASHYAENGGSFTLSVHNGGWEAFSLCIFTDKPALAIELTDAINDVLAKHQRLEGQFDAPAVAA